MAADTPYCLDGKPRDDSLIVEYHVDLFGAVLRDVGPVVKLWWTDHFANEWSEVLPDASTGLARLEALKVAVEGNAELQPLDEWLDARRERPTVRTHMSLGHVNAMLATLPAYAEVKLRCNRLRDQRLMARDLPGPDRRFTNLSSGTEWFLPLSENIEVTGLTITLDAEVRSS